MSSHRFTELELGQKKAEKERERRRQEDERREQELDRQSMEANKDRLVNCDICCEDRPPNRMVSCINPKENHTYCYKCVKQHIETIIGGNKHAPLCMESDCNIKYPRQVVEQVLDRATIARMDRMKQNEDLAAAGIENLEECPFCNFKAIIEGMTRLDCGNPECEMSSCVKCDEPWHPSMTCAQWKRKKKGEKGGSKGSNLRHLVAEAMTEALIRHCPGCQAPFTKEGGCNKIRCSSCGQYSCYICRVPIGPHGHFGAGGCPQFDVTEERNEAEVKKAENVAIGKVKRENVGITDEDIKIIMSDKVKDDDKHRADREKAFLRGEHWQPGMPIDGGDPEVERDVRMQQQMRGRGEMGMGEIEGFAPAPGMFPPLPARMRPGRGGGLFTHSAFQPPWGVQQPQIWPLPMQHPSHVQQQQSMNRAQFLQQQQLLLNQARKNQQRQPKTKARSRLGAAPAVAANARQQIDAPPPIAAPTTSQNVRQQITTNSPPPTAANANRRRQPAANQTNPVSGRGRNPQNAAEAARNATLARNQRPP